MKLFRYAYRSAITGRYVTKAFAERHKATTYRVRVWFWQRDADL